MPKWLLIRIFGRCKLKQVFTPSTVAKLTYIKRGTLESDVKKFIQIPGTQLVLFGHSGCGKTTLITNELESAKMRYIRTSCRTDTTLEDLILYAFDKLNLYLDTEKTLSRKVMVSSELKTKYKQIQTQISAQLSEGASITSKRVLPLQLTPQRLAEFLGAACCIWIIEDFHKVKDDEKRKIADVMKIFMDTAIDYPTVKIICIGAVGTGRELIELDSNLSTRVSETLVPLLTNEELDMMVERGFKLMNVYCDKQMRSKIIYYSNNLAAVCHQICFDICHNFGIEKTSILLRIIGEKDFKKAVASYVRKNSDTFLYIFDLASQVLERKQVLTAAINTGKDSISIEELYETSKRIKKMPYETFQKHIDDLCSPKYNEILRVESASKRLYFSNPFFQAFLKMKLALESLESRKEKRGLDAFQLKDFETPANFISKWFNDDKVLQQYFNELENTISKRRDAYINKNLQKKTRIEEIKNNLVKKDS